jgi:hypothetical protein
MAAFAGRLNLRVRRGVAHGPLMPLLALLRSRWLDLGPGLSSEKNSEKNANVIGQ